jgi:hypothetical protein
VAGAAAAGEALEGGAAAAAAAGETTAGVEAGRLGAEVAKGEEEEGNGLRGLVGSRMLLTMAATRAASTTSLVSCLRKDAVRAGMMST